MRKKKYLTLNYFDYALYVWISKVTTQLSTVQAQSVLPLKCSSFQHVFCFFSFILHIFFTFSFRHSWMWLVWYAGTVISYNPYLVPLISKWHTEQIHRLLIQPRKVVNHWTWKHILLYLPSRFELLLYERHSVYHFILTCAFWNSNAAQKRQEWTLLFKLFASASLISIFFFPTLKLSTNRQRYLQLCEKPTIWHSQPRRSKPKQHSSDSWRLVCKIKQKKWLYFSQNPLFLLGIPCPV